VERVFIEGKCVEGIMKPVWAILVAVTLVASFVAGHVSRDAVGADLATLESFRQSMVEENALTRSIQFNGFLETLNENNLEEALVVVEAHYDWLSKNEARNLFFAWARFDPEGALKWGLSQPLRNLLPAASAAMYAWAFYNPEKARVALKKTKKMKDARRLKILEEKYVFGWIRRGDRERVSAYLARQPVTNIRQKATSKLAAEFMSEGAESLIGWVDSISRKAKDDYKAEAFQKAANMLAQVDPIRASQWIEPHLSKNYSDKSPLLIAKRWVERGDPDAAVEWLLSLPADQIRPNSVPGAMDRWRDLDADAANEWLRVSTPDEGLDRAVMAVARKDSFADPISALDWAERIQDPKQRKQLIVSTLQYWLSVEPDNAEQWIENSELAEDVRTEIRQGPKVPFRERNNRSQFLQQSGFEAIPGSDRVKIA
jgi:hypothetical protein